MLKNLFLPEKIGSYYLFPKRIIGFDIGKTQITGCQIFMRGRSATIEKIVTEALPQGPTPYQERVSSTLKTMLASFSSYDEIVSGISASIVFFKELSLPFSNRDKIKQMLEYEVESLLPFSIDQAVIDFIVTHTEQEKTIIMVAAVQKTQLAEHLAFFEAAGAEPSRVTVDLFSLYDLYQETPAYADNTAATVLTSIGFSTTKIAYLINKELKLIRTIPKGITSLVKIISEQLKISAHDAHEQLMRFGFEESENRAYLDAAHKALEDFFVPFQFTLQSFAKETKITPQKIVLLGGGANIKQCAQALTKQTDLPAELYNTDSLVNNSHLHFKNGHIPLEAIISLSAALPTPSNEQFNLRAKEFGLNTETRLFTAQSIIAATLTLLALGTLLGNNFWQIRKLNASIAQSEKQIFTTADQTVGIARTKRVDDAVDQVRRKVEEQERTWFSFTARTRSSFLNYLQTLSQHVDKEAIGLQLKKLLFTHDSIRMEGEVKDIPSLIILEEELKQTNLGSFTSPQEPKFAITITVKKKTGEDA